ncbi:MAG: HPr(Ser) kinase/phosphatase [Proteocatella sp.]
MIETLSVKEMIEEMQLNCINLSTKDYQLELADVNRPGMQLIGYYMHFPADRLQIIGNAEFAYLETLSDENLKLKLDEFLSHDIPAVCITRGHKPNQIFCDLVKKHDKNLILSDLPTTKFINKVSEYVNHKLAPVEVTHGVLVDVDGVGILIKGDSGVGKSETALELIKRGHRLISDDAVEIKLLNDDILVGQSPELTRYMIEIRGIGLLDIKSLYGVGAVKPTKTIDLVAYLEVWQEGKYYDRLGIDDDLVEILGIKIPRIIIPVRPGRNLAVILEIAARNQRQKEMGYNAAQEFNERLIDKLTKK